MQDAMKAAVWEHKGRPCTVTAQERVARPKIGGKNYGTYDRLTVEYLDGQEPRMGYFGLQTWGGQAKKLKGTKALVWGRVRHLVLVEGMKADRAMVQAAAEAAKGVLTEAPAAHLAEQEAVF